MSTADLSTTLDALAAIAAKAGLDAGSAREEGERLAAAVAESATGAFLEWCDQTGRPISAELFITAAMAGRRFRQHPTPLVTQLHNAGSPLAGDYARALAEVATAAALLGETTPASAGAAQSAASVQLGAAAGFGAPPSLPTDREFVKQAPQILTSVLARLTESQRRLLDLQQLDPFGAGAIPGIGGTVDPPAGTVAGEPPPAQAAPPPSDPSPPAVEPARPAEPQKSLEELLAELDALVGLSRVKAEIHRQTAVLRVEALRDKAGLKSPTITRHLVFVGNPGTGKTTVARLVSGIYRAVGLLSKGQLVEVDRSELVAGYLGQTAMKTAEVVARAVGGVLFIDEAYSLSGDQYGEEAINTLVKEMEDKRDDLVVIVAGYPLPMQVFITQNPGLASRFRTTIGFDDYTDAELEEIFTRMVAAADYDLGPGCLEEFRKALAGQVRDETFGNGRFARNVLEAAIGRHAWRLREVAEPTVEQLRTLQPPDVALEESPVVSWDVPGGTPAAAAATVDDR